MVKKEKETKEAAFRVYLADAVKLISENTANFASGKYMTVRYLDLINPKPEDTRTEAEIIAQVRKGWEV